MGFSVVLEYWLYAARSKVTGQCTFDDLFVLLSYQRKIPVPACGNFIMTIWLMFSAHGGAVFAMLGQLPTVTVLVTDVPL